MELSLTKTNTICKGYITRIEPFLFNHCCLFFSVDWSAQNARQAKKWHFFQSYAKMSTFHQQLCLSHEVCRQNSLLNKYKNSHFVDFSQLGRYDFACSKNTLQTNFGFLSITSINIVNLVWNFKHFSRITKAILILHFGFFFSHLQNW